MDEFICLFGRKGDVRNPLVEEGWGFGKDYFGLGM